MGISRSTGILVSRIISIGIVLGIADNCQAKKAEEPIRMVITGRVVDEKSAGVAGVTVRGFTYTDLTEATTDHEGNFELNVVEKYVKSLAILADDFAEDRMGVYKADWYHPPSSETPVEISLAASRHLPVEVLTVDGEPAAETRVGAVISHAPLVQVVTDESGRASLRVPKDGELQSLYASKSEVGFDYRVVSTVREQSYRADWLEDEPIQFRLAEAQTIRINLLDEEESPIVGTEISLWYLQKPEEVDDFNFSYAPKEFREKTDEAGIAEFRGVPNWEFPWLTFWPRTEKYERSRINFNPKVNPDGHLTVKLNRLVPMSGRVRFADGKSAAGIRISLIGAGYKIDRFQEEVVTDKEGWFRALVAPELLYILVVQDVEWGASVVDGIVVRKG